MADVSASVWYLTTVLFALGVIFLLSKLLSIGMRGSKCPPGPPTLPIIGNLHQIPKKDLHIQYQKWAEQYGPIFHLKEGSTDVIVLAKGHLIRKLVEKRSGNYADRPKSYMQDVYEHSRIVMRGYNDLWKLERKLYHQFLNINKVGRYTPYQDLETKQLCLDLLEDPDRFEAHITRMTTSLSASMAYGFRVSDLDNPVMKELVENSHVFFRLVYSSPFLDWYPQLRPLVRLFPSWIFPEIKTAKEYYRRERILFYELYQATVKAKIDEETLPSFAADIATAQETWKGSVNGDLLTNHAASYLAGTVLEAGADTTSNEIAAFFKAMMLFPHVQKLAQKEIDEVIGDDRLPEANDFDALPYVRATVKETLRWFPTGINGALPHASRAEDEIDGYVIPKGATIVLAIWAANNDPELFPDPRNFDPARHNANLTVFEATTASDIRDHDGWTFGAGRRICPGIHFAERTMFLSLARILWAFNIQEAKDASGTVIEVDRDAMTSAIAARPLPFKCDITPRSGKRADMIRKAWSEAQTLLNDAGNYKRSVI